MIEVTTTSIERMLMRAAAKCAAEQAGTEKAMGLYFLGSWIVHQIDALDDQLEEENLDNLTIARLEGQREACEAIRAEIDLQLKLMGISCVELKGTEENLETLRQAST